MENIINNPDFLLDVKNFFDLSLTFEEIQEIVTEKAKSNPLTIEDEKEGRLPLDKKLETFIDRIEFIKHLQILSDNAENNNFTIDGQEVVGVHWDIDALRIYLALTCIDILKENKKNHRDSFIETFKKLSPKLNAEIINNLTIIEQDKRETKENSSIAEFLYDIRNAYTHAGKRFHSKESLNFTLRQTFIVGKMKDKKMKKMKIEKGFDLVDFVLKVSIENAKRVFGF